MKKTIFLAIFALVFLLNPASTKAFQIEQLYDPLCLFACDNDSHVPSTGYYPPPVYHAPPPPVHVYNNNYIAPLEVSCYPNFTNANIGETVTWRATASGGTGVYNISWTGSNGLSGSGPSTSIRYNSSGSKSASVNVVSGVQTISRNCGSVSVYGSDNNNDDYYNDYDYDRDLDVSCYPNYYSANVGETVTWRSSVHGGNGDYNIRWSGTEGLSDSGSSAKMTYDYAGTKRASVTVRSGGRSTTRSCSTVEVYDDNRDYNRNYYDDNRYYNTPLTVSCSANTAFAPVGTKVSWQAYASGGSGSYTYRWSGTDSVNGYNNLLEIIYNAPGTKIASVSVTSRGQTITQACSNSVLVGAPVNTYQNTNYQAPNTIIKYVEAPAKTTKPAVVKATPTPTPTASLLTLPSISWGWVSFLVILVLLFLVVYLIFNKTK